ncbi:hypothetical protein D9758_013275 [Tetrapyrgos nigripes]|uniref:Uncharacterized protein n=1 Tax=Tetrapyrgos nigripes TaxID=182062 RepID=A0A8H5FPH9_9AGAR|nr:hypothetical protein D9758_013275 [Tetrapyrgos nigripes]
MDPGTIQNETADQIGYDAYFSLIKIQSCSLAYGLYVPVAAAAFQITWRRHVGRQANRTPTRWLLGLFTVIFFSTTAWFSLVAVQQYLNFRYIYHPVNGNTPSLNERLDAVELLYEKLFSVTPFLQGINAIDSIVVWRALSLWPRKKYLRYIFGFWIFASAVIALADGFNTVVINIRAAGDASKVDGWQRLDSSSMLVSLSINVAATTLILFKAWRTRQTWRDANLGGSMPYRILISLIECGFLFCVIQALNASVALQNGNSSSLGTLEMFVQSFAVMTPIFAGTYPSIVLLIVQQRSVIDGETDVVIFDTTISTPAQHGHGNVNGHNLTSIIRLEIYQASDLESGNGNLTACGEESRGAASNGRSPPKELGA